MNLYLFAAFLLSSLGLLVYIVRELLKNPPANGEYKNVEGIFRERR